MKRLIALTGIILGLVSCNGIADKMNLSKKVLKDTVTTIVSNDTIPTIRKSIKSSAVATFNESIKDEFNNWSFSITVFETKETFKFLTKIRYKELIAFDTLRIPNFGIYPKVVIKKGKLPQSCIVGFEDKKGNFKEHKMIAIKNNQLRISVLKSYFVGVYATKIQG